MIAPHWGLLSGGGKVKVIIDYIGREGGRGSLDILTRDK